MVAIKSIVFPAVAAMMASSVVAEPNMGRAQMEERQLSSIIGDVTVSLLLPLRTSRSTFCVRFDSVLDLI